MPETELNFQDILHVDTQPTNPACTLRGTGGVGVRPLHSPACGSLNGGGAGDAHPPGRGGTPAPSSPGFSPGRHPDISARPLSSFLAVQSEWRAAGCGGMKPGRLASLSRLLSQAASLGADSRYDKCRRLGGRFSPGGGMWDCVAMTSWWVTLLKPKWVSQPARHCRGGWRQCGVRKGCRRPGNSG